MNVLFTASVEGHLKRFHVPYLRYFKDRGYSIHTAARGGNDIDFVDAHFDIAFERSPFSLKNIVRYITLKKIICSNGYDIIHCRTPVVGVLTRLAARKARKSGTTVIYTAHGFHFYDGAPFFKAKLFMTIEKFLCRYTDCLITINSEDYNAVTRYGFKPGSFYKVSGVGVDPLKFTFQTESSKKKAREAYGISPDAYVLIFAAEYSARKNQEMLFNAMEIIIKHIPGCLLLLPGEGPLRKRYGHIINALGLNENVRLMGYRNDMESLLHTADVAVSSSLQEGLPINIAEAMAVSLPVVATSVRGHVDIVSNGANGFLVGIGDAKAMAERIVFIHDNPVAAAEMKKESARRAAPYFLQNAGSEIFKIYNTIINKRGVI